MAICPVTGKVCDNEQTFHISDICDGEVRQATLCHECAKSHFNDERMAWGSPPDMPDLMQIVSHILGDAESPPVPAEACPNCGSTIESIIRMGRLGCLACYAHFGPHGLDRALGGDAKPGGGWMAQGENLDEYVRRLRSELSVAVAAEDFESATALRDRLRVAERVRAEVETLREMMENSTLRGDAAQAGEFKDKIDEAMRRLGKN